MLKNREAKKLWRTTNIDIKYMCCLDYVNSVDNKWFKNKLINWLILWVFIIAVFNLLIVLMIKTTWADEEPKITYANLSIEWMEKPPFKLYSRLKDECYAQNVKDKAHCIRTWLSIAYAESSWKDLSTPFWLQSKEKWYKKWVKSYKLFWHKAQDWHFFYWDWGELGKSYYCTSEQSSWSNLWCPFWKKNFERIFYNLKF